MGDRLPKAQFNLKHKEVLDTFLLDIPFVNTLIFFQNQESFKYD